MKVTLENMNCEVSYTNNGTVVISGTVGNVFPNAHLVYWAASPPDYRTGYTGSGLPYANYEMAYDNTPNKGMLPLTDGSFTFNIHYPSGYYTGLGTVFVKPHLNLQVNTANQIGKVHVIPLGEGIPFRMLTYPPMPETAPRGDVMFYAGRESLPVRTQEQILRDSAYPDEMRMPPNFWGLRPSEP
jgi:hypothetical protein